MPVPINRAFLGRGLSFPFAFTTKLGGTSTQISSSISDGVERVRQSLLQILYTQIGERVMLRGFGTELRSLVFETLDKVHLDRVLFQVRRSIEAWERRVTIESLGVDLIDKRNGLAQIAVRFRIKSTNEPGNLVFPFYLGDVTSPQRMEAARTA